MIEKGVYLFLAIVGLGFLIFIHELGHYVVARRMGMTVEIFSIGLGKPIFKWKFQGVQWQFCWLFFGGYVRIAGQERKGSLEAHQIPGGFYAASPWKRIKVAFAGPFVNIALAFLAFSVIWMTGGQEKFFAQYTNVIGYLDAQSPLLPLGVRSGDQFTKVSGEPIQGYTQLFQQILLSKQGIEIEGEKIDYLSQQTTPFVYKPENSLKTTDVIYSLGVAPAQYLIFEGFSSADAPIYASGIEVGDRLLWVDGEFLFSNFQLVKILKNSVALVTVKRGDDFLISRLPRVKISDLRIDSSVKAEFDDWQHEAHLSAKTGQLYFIPYRLDHLATVESSLAYVDFDLSEKRHIQEERNRFDIPLEKGDQIVAVNGEKVRTSSEVLSALQTRKALVVVQRSSESQILPWKEADSYFETSFDAEKVLQIVNSMGTSQQILNRGEVYLLQPIALKSFADLSLDPRTKAEAEQRIEARRQQIEKIKNPEEKREALKDLDKSLKKPMLGAILQDQRVAYNPNPFALFGDVFEQTWKTLLRLVTGNLSPKMLSGPVGIVQVLQNSWASGIKDGLYWLGLVSLNLAFLNLLPIPVLDGGHILFSMIEGITKKRIKGKTMERLIIPFILLLIGFFIFATYHDILRLFGGH